MKISSLFVALTIILGFSIALPVTAQSPGAGDYNDALQRLESEADSPGYADFFLDVLRRAPDVAAVDDLAERYLSGVSDQGRRGEILFELGSLYELTNRVDRARTYYGQATRTNPGIDRYALAFARTSIEMGNPEEAIITLSRVVHTPDSYAEQREAALLRTRAYALTGQVDLAIAHAASLAGISHPVSQEPAAAADLRSLFLLGDLATEYSREDLRREVIRRMETLFPLAPETALLTDPDGDVAFYPNPSRLIGSDFPERPTSVTIRPLPRESRESTSTPSDREQDGDPEIQSAEPAATRGERDATGRPVADRESDGNETVLGIQTGSFRDRENAEYMVIDIEELGFSATIREVQVDDRRFYRVIVPAPGSGSVSDAQGLVVRLKERGVEGFLVFE
jgi:hypothetical protein